MQILSKGKNLINCNITQVHYSMPDFSKQMQSNISQDPEQKQCSTQGIFTHWKQMQETVVKTICVNLKCNAMSHLRKIPKFINMTHWRYIFIKMNFKKEETYLSEVQLGSFIRARIHFHKFAKLESGLLPNGSI